MITLIKRIGYLFFCMMFTVVANADETSDLVLKNIVPQFNTFTPEAASLGKYGTYGMTEYSGIPDISVPLFSIKSGSIDLPISLSYDASGIKVEQEATYVGLGWNLIMGGCINHIVCGNNDYWDKTIQYGYSFKQNDLHDKTNPMFTTEVPTYKNFDLLPEGHVLGVAEGTRDWRPKNEEKDLYDILRNVSEGYLVPDIFQASFCGHNVSFVINQDSQSNKAVIISDNATKYKIDIEFSGRYPKNITITDDHGMHYVFHRNFEEFNNERYSYYLWKIIDPGNRCLAEYEYQQCGNQGISDPYFETKGVLLSGSVWEPRLKLFLDPHGTRDLGFPRVHTICKVYPKSIKTLDNVITFQLEDRTDNKQYKRIKQIDVKNGSRTIHSAIFKYDNFKVSSWDKTRLKLTGIEIDGKNYTFEYIEQINGRYLPSMDSKSQDYWGYYNGASNSKEYCASPKFKIVNGKIEVDHKAIGDANRLASIEYCKIGVLNKIKYPTGGYTLFDYEANHFNDTCNYFYPSTESDYREYESEIISSNVGPELERQNNTSGILNVQKKTTYKIKYYCNYTGREWFQSYHTIQKKGDNGEFKFYDKYMIQNGSQKETYTELTLDSGDYRIVSEFKTNCDVSKLKESSDPNTINKGTNSGLMFYEQKLIFNSLVKEDVSGKSTGGGLRIKSMYNYDSNGDFLGGTKYSYKGGKLLIPTVRKEDIHFTYTTSSICLPYNPYVVYDIEDSDIAFIGSSPAYSPICSLGSSHIGYSTVTKEELDKNENVISTTISNYHNNAYRELESYNMFFESDLGMNGKLIESTTYSNNGADLVPLHSVKYDYSKKGQEPDIYTNDGQGLRLKSPVETVFFTWCRPECFEDVYNPYRIFKYSIYPKRNIWTYITSVTETNYDNGKAMKPVITTYEYKESNYQPNKITKTIALNNNTKDVTITRFWYPEDNDKQAINSSYLVDAHCISEKVKALESRNNKTWGGYVNVYGKTKKSLPFVRESYSIASDGQGTRELWADYDDYGNIREYKKKDGTPITIIWSYNHQHPIFEIIGKRYSELSAFSSDINAIENMTNVPYDFIRSLHYNMKQDMPDASITAFAYSPWQTVSRTIQPNGYETYYEYDPYGRLTSVRDASGIIQKYDYNYKTK